MRRELKDYFHFTKGERKGVLALVLLLFIILLIRQYFPSFEPEYYPIRKDLLAIQARFDSLDQEKAKKSFQVEEKILADTTMEAFDPNELALEGWQKLGLSSKQAQVILNYKEKAGGFKTKRQVQRMFVISDELYKEIENLILLPDTIEKQFKKKQYKQEKKNYSFKKKKLIKVRINTADTSQFKTLYGIGPVLAKRIVKRRNELGGFYSKNQLEEVWGLKQEVLDNLDTLLILDKVPLRKLNINTATKEELKKHPYLYWKQANAIVNYRKQHGNFKKLDDLKNVILVTDSIYNKVNPYLKR